MKNYIKLILFILIFNTTIININADTYRTYYFPNINTNEKEYLSFVEYNFQTNLSLEEKIYFSLENILNNNKNMVNYIPKGLVLLNVYFYKGHLILNFNQNIKNYGGTFFEIKFITQILANCFQFNEVEKVTFLTENTLQDLPEGSTIFKYTREDFELYNN